MPYGQVRCCIGRGGCSVRLCAVVMVSVLGVWMAAGWPRLPSPAWILLTCTSLPSGFGSFRSLKNDWVLNIGFSAINNLKLKWMQHLRFWLAVHSAVKVLIGSVLNGTWPVEWDSLLNTVIGFLQAKSWLSSFGVFPALPRFHKLRISRAAAVAMFRNIGVSGKACIAPSCRDFRVVIHFPSLECLASTLSTYGDIPHRNRTWRGRKGRNSDRKWWGSNSFDSKCG